MTGFSFHLSWLHVPEHECAVIPVCKIKVQAWMKG